MRRLVWTAAIAMAWVASGFGAAGATPASNPPVPEPETVTDCGNPQTGFGPCEGASTTRVQGLNRTSAQPSARISSLGRPELPRTGITTGLLAGAGVLAAVAGAVWSRPVDWKGPRLLVGTAVAVRLVEALPGSCLPSLRPRSPLLPGRCPWRRGSWTGSMCAARPAGRR